MVHFSLMGQSASVAKPGRRKSLRSFRKPHLSHTFVLHIHDETVELVNINQASEEELMTLPGINREIAKSIVEHRKAIGRFRKIEDLALVRGIGADKLESLRPEICVSCRRNPSCASSRAQSYDSLKSSDSKLVPVKGPKSVHVNKAGVFELQSVHGITQEIAAAIVHYRDKKGPFKKVDDLLKVKCMDRIRLDNVSRFLTTDSTEDECDSAPKPNILTNGYQSIGNHEALKNGGPVKLPVANGLPSASSLGDICELLSAYSPRPIIKEIFHYKRKGEPAIRLASWNLHDFTVEKANNPGVREVICRTILENGFSIVAVQEILEVEALKLLCEELNRPKLKRIAEWKDRNHNWNFCMLDVPHAKLGFIYDSDGVGGVELLSVLQGPDDTKLDCETLIATFRIADLTVQLVNLQPYKTAKASVLHERIKELVFEEEIVFVCADFSLISDMNDDWLSIGGLQSVLESTTVTTYLSTKIGTTGCFHISNLLHNSKAQQQVTGVHGLVRQGLTHLAIPNGWSWGGAASPYCPVWMEIFLNINVGTAL